MATLKQAAISNGIWAMSGLHMLRNVIFQNGAEKKSQIHIDKGTVHVLHLLQTDF